MVSDADVEITARNPVAYPTGIVKNARQGYDAKRCRA